MKEFERREEFLVTVRLRAIEREEEAVRSRPRDDRPMAVGVPGSEKTSLRSRSPLSFMMASFSGVVPLVMSKCDVEVSILDEKVMFQIMDGIRCLE